MVEENENYWTRLQRKRLSRRGLLRGTALGAAGLAAAAVVGCGGGEEAGPTGSPRATGGPTAPPRRGGPVAVTRGAEGTLDPYKFSTGPDQSAFQYVYSYLFKF